MSDDLITKFAEKWGGVTEEYRFYNGEVELRYDPKEHVYLLVKDGKLIPQDGVTTIVHIIDKSEALIPWAAKQIAQKIFNTVPVTTLPTGERTVNLPWSELERLVLEAKTAPKEKLEEAADIGSIAHAWIERYINTVLEKDQNATLDVLAKFPDDERARNCCTAALDWMWKHNVRWLGTERKIYSRKYSYAGTMDGLCVVDSCDNPLCCPEPFKDHLSVCDWKSSNALYIEMLYQTAAYEQAHEEEFGVDVKDRWINRLGKTDGEFESWHADESTFELDFAGFKLCLDLVRNTREVKKRVQAIKEQIRTEKKRIREEEKATKLAEEKRLKEEAKAKAKADKETALALKCKGADKYKGTRPPKCNGGKPCKTCLATFATAQAKKAQPVDKLLKKTKSKKKTVPELKSDEPYWSNAKPFSI